MPACKRPAEDGPVPPPRRQRGADDQPLRRAGTVVARAVREPPLRRSNSAPAAGSCKPAPSKPAATADGEKPAVPPAPDSPIVRTRSQLAAQRQAAVAEGCRDAEGAPCGSGPVCTPAPDSPIVRTRSQLAAQRQTAVAEGCRDAEPPRRDGGDGAGSPIVRTRSQLAAQQTAEETDRPPCAEQLPGGESAPAAPGKRAAGKAAAASREQLAEAAEAATTLRRSNSAPVLRRQRTVAAPLKRANTLPLPAPKRQRTAPEPPQAATAGDDVPAGATRRGMALIWMPAPDAPALLRSGSGSRRMPCQDVAEETEASRSLLSGLKCRQWRKALSAEFTKQYFVELAERVMAARASDVVFPPAGKEFAALNATPLSKVRVVIIGQDPYHDDGQAEGLCFSVPHGVPPPPSLKNMYTELEQDIPGFVRPQHGHLMDWAKQGVLLLNSSLTVTAHEANSHKKFGWDFFTDVVIDTVSGQCDGVVFLLWGLFAQKKCRFIDHGKHTVIQTAHPSPLSVTKWRGCRCFSACNEALVALGKREVDWTLRPRRSGQKTLTEMFAPA